MPDCARCVQKIVQYRELKNSLQHVVEEGHKRLATQLAIELEATIDGLEGCVLPFTLHNARKHMEHVRSAIREGNVSSALRHLMEMPRVGEMAKGFCHIMWVQKRKEEK